MSYRRITVTASTLGQANPAEVEGRKPYKWNGDPAKSEAARTAGRPRQVPESLRGSPNARREEREERYARFCELRDEGMGKIAAGAEVGIERRAAARYEKQRLEEGGDG
jgi:hypothetical protein